MPDSVRDNVGKAKLVICPYCGHTQPIADRCRSCGGLFEPLSRQATHNAMGPWFIRDENRPFQPGCSYETMVRLVQRGRITTTTIIRGPTTRQFWTIAKRVPGIAHRLGYCHECVASVDPADHSCHACGAPFSVSLDRNFLGLPEYRPMPGEGGAEPAAEGTGARGVPMSWPAPRPAATPPTGGSISSFATDEEVAFAATPLQGNGHAARERQPDDAGVEAEAAEAMGTGTDSTTSSSPTASSVESILDGDGEDPLEQITVRALRRRVAVQRQAIQRLRLVIAALGIIALIALVGWTIVTLPATPGHQESQGGAPEAGDASGEPQRMERSKTRSEPAVVPGEREPQTAPAPDEQSPASDHMDESRAPSDASADTPTDKPSTSGAGGDSTGAYDLASYERAIERLSFSHDESQPLAQRIEACEETVTLLSDLAERLTGEAKPGDLDRRLQEAKRHLERLRCASTSPDHGRDGGRRYSRSPLGQAATRSA